MKAKYHSENDYFSWGLAILALIFLACAAGCSGDEDSAHSAR